MDRTRRGARARARPPRATHAPRRSHAPVEAGRVAGSGTRPARGRPGFPNTDVSPGSERDLDLQVLQVGRCARAQLHAVSSELKTPQTHADPGVAFQHGPPDLEAEVHALPGEVRLVRDAVVDVDL